MVEEDSPVKVAVRERPTVLHLSDDGRRRQASDRPPNDERDHTNGETSEAEGGDDDDDYEEEDDYDDGHDGDDEAADGQVDEKMFRRDSRIVKEEAVRDPDSVTALLQSRGATSKRNGTGNNYDDDMEIQVEDDQEVKTMKDGTDGDSDADDDAEAERRMEPIVADSSLLERLRPSCLQLVVIGVGIVLILLVVIVGVAVSFGDDGLRSGGDSAAIWPLDINPDQHYVGRRHIQTMTHCGPVEGVVQDGSLAFYGMPYSAPPIGPLRWKPSELVQRFEDCWPGVYKAHKPKPICYQKPLEKPFESMHLSEDCLYLDVYTPRVTFNDPMPVVVYFAGDSFQGHDAVDFRWRPSARLARKKQVVFVVVYYRMNAFGFLALELLTRNVHPPTSGNYGIHDMLTALKWVHRNIDGFGGDPAKVTLLGHGSGATGVLALLSSRLARLLFNQAWMTGGSTNFVNKTLREVERNNEAFNRHLMCDTTECLYNKTAEQIVNAIPVSEWPFWGVPNHLELPTNDEHTAAIAIVDGAILYDIPSTVWENNDFVDVALVVGSSLHSVASKLPDGDVENFDWTKFNATVKAKLATFGADVVSDALKHYYDDDHDDPPDDESEEEISSPTRTPLEAYVTMLSDLRVTCPLLNLAYRASKVFTNNVYFYLSTYVPEGAVRYVNVSEKRMAAHGLDVAAIFDMLPSVLMSNPTDADMAYQRTMQDMFYRFVERGRPTAAAASANGSIRGKINPKMPWTLNYVSEMLDSSTERYINCDLWTSHGMYPKHGRTN